MNHIPSELRYSKSHEWIRLEGNGIAIVGITDHAQSLLGDLVYVELPEVDTSLKAGDEAGVVESVKAASDVYTPVSGEIIEINEALATAPELVNDDPYGHGWLFKIQLDDENELEELLDSDGYEEMIAADDH